MVKSINSQSKNKSMFYTPVTTRRPEEGFKSTYFEVESDGGDSKFLQSISRLLPQKPSRDVGYPGCFQKEVPMSKLKDMLATVLLEPKCQPLWEEYWEMAEQSNNYSFYNKAIQLAANFVCILVSKDGIYDYCHEDSLNDQINNLWESYVAKEGKKGRPLDQVWKNTVLHLKNDQTDQYSLITRASHGPEALLITDSDVSAMICEYDHEVKNRNSDFDKPYDSPSKFEFPRLIEGSHTATFHIEVSKIDHFPTLKPDDYTRLLVILSRDDLAEIVDILLSGVDSVDHATIPTLDKYGRKDEEPLRNLHLIFYVLAMRIQSEIRRQMAVLIRPWAKLFLPVLSTIPAVCEVFEVAELRRRALGRRFFTRDLLVWSFYKLGYALPPIVRDAVKTVKLNTAAEDHPLSQICRAATKLALSLGVKTIELHHVIFAGLYPDEIDVDAKFPIGSDVVAHFNDFMQAVVVDTNNRPQRTSTRQDDFEHIFKGGKSNFIVTGLDGTRNKMKFFVA